MNVADNKASFRDRAVLTVRSIWFINDAFPHSINTMRKFAYEPEIYETTIKGNHLTMYGRALLKLNSCK